MPTETYESNGITYELGDPPIPSAPQRGESYSVEDLAKTVSKAHPDWNQEQCMNEAQYLINSFLLEKHQERRQTVIAILVSIFLIFAAGIVILKS